MQKNRLGNFPTRFIIEPFKRANIRSFFCSFLLFYTSSHEFCGRIVAILLVC